jgi:hypothetical protein
MRERLSREKALRGAVADTPHVTQIQHHSLQTMMFSGKAEKSMKLIREEVTGRLHGKI